MWKIFVMGPFSISLTFNVLLKNQKENNLPTFSLADAYKKGLVLKAHTVIYEK